MKEIIDLTINGIGIQAEIDTGCTIILVGSKLYRQHFSKIHLSSINRPLFDASNNRINLLGIFSTTIQTKNQRGTADTFVQ